MIDGHGDDIHHLPRPLRANFSSNVYPHADLTGLRQHLCAHIQAIGHYPEPRPCELERRIAACRGVPADAVVVTSGATEGIYLIAKTFGGTRTAVLQPTFSEYADACRMYGHRVSPLYQWPDRLPVDVRMLWLCTPNNPTGTVPPKAALLQLIGSHPEVCFVIDLSYEAFTLQPLLSPAEAVGLPNVLLIHSLTKRFAIPGLRVGYLTGSPALISRIRSRLMPWSVNALAVEAGMYLFSANPSKDATMLDLPTPALTAYLHETVRFRQALQQLGGLDVWPTDAHFFLCRLRMGHAAALREYLLHQHGLLIRDASNFDGLDAHFIRLSTQSPQANDVLVRAIGEYFSIP